jgi:predicted nucleic acid-binding protein
VIVVDASIALAWCLSDEEDELAERVLVQVASDGGIAPAHWPLEVANGLLAAERRGRLEVTDSDRARRLLADLQIEIIPIELSTAAGMVLDTARSHGLSAYDAAYLDLANFRRLALATLDTDLSRAAAAAGVPIAR